MTSLNSPNNITGKILHLNLSNEKITQYTYPEQFVQKYLGGRGFNARILYEFSDITHQITKKNTRNVICISPGFLCGSEMISTARCTVSVLKSPVTGRFSDGNLGGHFGPALKLRGIGSIVITGKAKAPVSLLIPKDGEPKLVCARTEWKWGNNATQIKYSRKYKAKVLSIGQAGVNKAFCATVACENRVAGGGGVGAVFGSKNLKAVIVEYNEDESIDAKYPTLFNDNVESAEEHVKSHPVYDLFRKFGTTSLVEIHSGIKYFPSFNFTKRTFGKWTKISGKALLKHDIAADPQYEKKVEEMKESGKIGCKNCPVACSHPLKIEYETLNCLGSKIGVNNLDFILAANGTYMNDAGIDVIQVTSIISTFMEMSADKVVDFEFKWGDEDAIYNFFIGITGSHHSLSRNANKYQRLGKACRDSAYIGLFSEYLKGNIDVKIPDGKSVWDVFEPYFVAEKGNALSGVYPSKSSKGSALAIATSSRGADHLRSLPTLATYASWYFKGGSLKTRLLNILKVFTIPFQAIGMMKKDAKFVMEDLYTNYVKVFGVPEYIAEEWKELGFLTNRDQYSGWGSIVKFCQEMYAVADSIGLCRFLSPWRFGIGPSRILPLLTSFAGLRIESKKRLLEVGEHIYVIERYLSFKDLQTTISASTGKSKLQDGLPVRFFKGRKGLSEKGFHEMLEDYYERCGYENDGTIPESLVKSAIEVDFTSGFILKDIRRNTL